MINYIETHIVEHCNLNCRGCSHFSSLAPPNFKKLEDFQQEFLELQKITNGNIKTIRLMGGEPLLHPQVLDFCKITRELFPYSEIVLVSNGILLHKLTNEDIHTFNKLKIGLCISDYNIKIDKNKMNQFDIHYFHPKGSMYNISLDLTCSQDYVQAFRNCDLVQGGWYFFKKYRIYQCCIMANIEYFNAFFQKNIQYDLDDISIDIRNHTLKDIESFLKTPHEACKYCNTIQRHHSYQPFSVGKKEIIEWICQ